MKYIFPPAFVSIFTGTLCLVAILSLLLAAGCGHSVTGKMGESTSSLPLSLSVSRVDFVGTRWVLIAINGAPTALQPSLQFISATQAGGNAGCNTFGGSAVINGHSMRFGPLAATRKLCLGPEMAVETQFLKMLDSVRRAHLVDGHLELLSETGVVLARFNRVL